MGNTYSYSHDLGGDRPMDNMTTSVIKNGIRMTIHPRPRVDFSSILSGLLQSQSISTIAPSSISATIDSISIPFHSSVLLSLLSSLESSSQSNLEPLQLNKEEYSDAKEENKDVCSICRSPFVNKEIITRLDCTHFFHFTCIESWGKYKAECPLCRKEIPRV